MMTDTITPAMLSVRDAATYLAISERSVWSLLKSNRLAAVRFNKTVRITRDDLDDFIRQCRTGGNNG